MSYDWGQRGVGQLTLHLHEQWARDEWRTRRSTWWGLRVARSILQAIRR